MTSDPRYFSLGGGHIYLFNPSFAKFTMEGEQTDFTTTPCEWIEKDAEYVVDYEIHKELGLEDVRTLDIKE